MDGDKKIGDHYTIYSGGWECGEGDRGFARDSRRVLEDDLHSSNQSLSSAVDLYDAQEIGSGCTVHYAGTLRVVTRQLLQVKACVSSHGNLWYGAESI